MVLVRVSIRHLIVQMRTCRIASIPTPSNQVSTFHRLAVIDVKLAEMCINCFSAVIMFNLEPFTKTIFWSVRNCQVCEILYCPIGRSKYFCPLINHYVYAGRFPFRSSITAAMFFTTWVIIYVPNVCMSWNWPFELFSPALYCKRHHRTQH